MKLRTSLLPLVALLAFASPAFAQQAPGFWTTPAIKGIGPVHVWPQATLRPSATATYKAVFDVTRAGDASKINPGLDHIARAVNVFAAAGVPLTHLKFTVIVHGPATPVVLDEKSFQAKFGHANPDLAVIEALKKAGVQLLVCGNALGDMGYTPSEVNPDVKVALSALSTLIILQDQGYALITM
jgi:intracellular sulfur oxidation DsrE/DsrF family protein